MKRSWVAILFAMLVVIGCKKEEPSPSIRYFWGTLQVTVRYQDGTTGPEIPVYLYYNHEDKKANLFAAAGKTNQKGEVRFDELRAGFYLIQAYQLNPDTTSLNPYAHYAEDSVWVSPDTITYKEVRLFP